jgi:H+-translocating NAD(P) transhydrogenase subunit alpha
MVDRAGILRLLESREAHDSLRSEWQLETEHIEADMGSNLIDALFVFMLAAFIGFEVIRHVSPLLHTPLMSLTNALDAIAVVGAIVLVGERKSAFATVVGVIAIVAATSNVVGGFLITDRMLKMFKTSRPVKK